MGFLTKFQGLFGESEPPKMEERKSMRDQGFNRESVAPRELTDKQIDFAKAMSNTTVQAAPKIPEPNLDLDQPMAYDLSAIPVDRLDARDMMRNDHEASFAISNSVERDKQTKDAQQATPQAHAPPIEYDALKEAGVSTYTTRTQHSAEDRNRVAQGRAEMAVADQTQSRDQGHEHDDPDR